MVFLLLTSTPTNLINHHSICHYLLLAGELYVNVVHSTNSNHRQAYVQTERCTSSHNTNALKHHVCICCLNAGKLYVNGVDSTDSNHRPKFVNNELSSSVSNPSLPAGELCVNGVHSTDSNHRQAYVEQNDNFYSMLTVAETLTFASQLQLSKNKSEAQRQEYVDNLVSVLGLAKSKDTRVGNEKIRGLSGGEKKRLAIGCELISSPSLLFLDEPTTGLDSFQAEKVCLYFDLLSAFMLAYR